jgi:hypothetical protein
VSDVGQPDGQRRIHRFLRRRVGPELADDLATALAAQLLIHDVTPVTQERHQGRHQLRPGRIPPEQIVELPTDPAQLSDVLSERLYAGQPKGSCPIPPGWDRRRPLGRCPHRPVTDRDRFGAIVLLLTNYPLPAQLRSALYQALTRLDGIELTGEVTDQAGRRVGWC